MCHERSTKTRKGRGTIVREGGPQVFMNGVPTSGFLKSKTYRGDERKFHHESQKIG